MLNEIEIWVDIIGFEGYYQVSNLGRVKSVSRMIKNSVGDGYRSVKERILKPGFNRQNGYLSVSLQKNGISKTYTIHVLVAKAFVEGFSPYLEVNHKNCIKTDNRHVNLEWVQLIENRRHASVNGLTARGERHGITKLTEKEAIEIKYGYKDMTQQEIADIYGVHKHTIGNIRRGIRWKFLK